MTYDVQRWDIFHTRYGSEIVPDDSGDYVLAADAEAHEKAAVEQTKWLVFGEQARKTERQQAIRDCIAAVKALGLCNCSASVSTADDLHNEWCIERVTLERLALLTEGSEK